MTGTSACGQWPSRRYGKKDIAKWALTLRYEGVYAAGNMAERSLPLIQSPSLEHCLINRSSFNATLKPTRFDQHQHQCQRSPLWSGAVLVLGHMALTRHVL